MPLEELSDLSLLVLEFRSQNTKTRVPFRPNELDKCSKARAAFAYFSQYLILGNLRKRRDPRKRRRTSVEAALPRLPLATRECSRAGQNT